MLTEHSFRRTVPQLRMQPVRCVFHFKMVGKLTDGNKFTLRNASLTGCPQGLESSAIVGNSTTVQIADLKIYCCHKHLCNRALSQSYSLSNTLISIVFVINSIYLLAWIFK
ncbi:unnamed protein product [Rotaria socialis]